MIYVIDQNVMRSGRPGTMVLDRPDVGFVIPDVSFEEMVKHERWEETLRRSFAELEPTLERVFISAPVGELLRYERINRQPVGLEQLLPAELTEGCRDLVRMVLAEDDGSAAWRRNVDQARLNVIGERSRGSDKKKMTENVYRLRQLIGPMVMTRLRHPGGDRNAMPGLVKVYAERFFRESFQLDTEAAGFAPFGFLTTRCIGAMLWYQLRWLIESGLADAKPTTLANDEFDMDYVLTASFFDGFLSNDRRASRCAEDIRIMADEAADGRLREAYRVLVEVGGQHPAGS